MTPVNPETFAARLRAEFDRSDLTITEAAGRCKLHYNTFRNYLSGKSLPRKPQLVRLRKTFKGLSDAA